MIFINPGHDVCPHCTCITAVMAKQSGFAVGAPRPLRLSGRGALGHKFSKCSVRSPRAPRAIRLLIKILTWLILQLSKEAITALMKFIVGLRKLWSISSWVP